MKITNSTTSSVTDLASASTEWNIESTTNLGASATFTGSARDAWLMTGSPKDFYAHVSASHAGTLRVEQSTDGTTWRRASADVAVAAGGVGSVRLPVTARYYRVVYVNGATATTSLMITSRLFS